MLGFSSLFCWLAFAGKSNQIRHTWEWDYLVVCYIYIYIIIILLDIIISYLFHFCLSIGAPKTTHFPLPFPAILCSLLCLLCDSCICITTCIMNLNISFFSSPLAQLNSLKFTVLIISWLEK